MYRKVTFLVVLALLLSAFVFVGSSLAQGTGTNQNQNQAQDPNMGTGPGNAMGAPSGQQTLNAGQRRWYAFRYGGDNSEITIRLSANPADSAMFSVFTQADIANDQPTGRSTSNPNLNGDQFWSGTFNSSGVYYIRVETVGNQATSYTLQLNGTNVSWGAAQQAQGEPQAQGTPQAQATPQGQGTPQAGQQGTAAQAPSTLPVTGGGTPTAALVVAALGALSIFAGLRLRRAHNEA